MEAFGVFMARQDTSMLHCTACDLNTVLHATAMNNFSNQHSGLKYLPLEHT